MKQRTLILDIDGCIFRHHGQGASYQWSYETAELLEGVTEFFDWAESESMYILLLTARKESCRAELENLLTAHGLFFDELVMGVGHGPRILVNDVKPQVTEPSALAFTIPRNGDLSRLIHLLSADR